jgi:hypothetical protein
MEHPLKQGHARLKPWQFWPETEGFPAKSPIKMD